MAETKAKKIENYKGEREFALIKDSKTGLKKGSKVMLTYELYTIFKKLNLV